MKNLSYYLFFWILCCLGCQSTHQKKEEAPLNYQLVKIDSFRIDHMGTISALDYKNGHFALYDGSQNTIVLANDEGTILSKRQFPKEGPGSIRNIMSIKLDTSGEVLLYSLSGNLLILNQQLEIIAQPKPPITYMLRSMRYNSQVINRWGDYLIVYYPGRDDVSPYTHHYFVNNYLMEKINIHTQQTEPILRLPESSKFNSEQFFDQTTVVTTLDGNILYWALGSDPKVFAFDLHTNQLINTYEFEPSLYHTLAPQENAVGYVNFMLEADISAIFTSKKYLAVYYHTGIDKETFLNNELNEPENYDQYPRFQHYKIKFWEVEHSRWSNEITVSPDVEYVLNFDSPEQFIYGLRNDEFTQEEEPEFLTIYKMRLEKF